MPRTFLSITLILFLSCPLAHGQTPPPRIRISAWYWLNAAPKSDWKGDFTTMKQMGFTDVLLCWGLDISAIATRKSDTHLAFQYAHDAGIGVYLLLWHPHANSLPQNPKFMQISADGKPLPSFDVFNPEWRSTQWKSYLQDVVQTYHNEPALTGYAFDDSFPGGSYSYGPFEQKTFGSPLPRKPADPNWDKWVSLRQQWWEDWASDTVSYIRAVDPNPDHIIYIEDTVGSITDTKRAANKGLDFARVAKHFDAVGGYTTPVWTDSPDSAEKVSKLTTNAIQSVRNIIGPDKKIIYTFWSADISQERKPGPASRPTASDIQSICQDALKLGIHHLDLYGYRIGEYQATREQMAHMVPPEPAPYTLTGQFPQKFLFDRPETHDPLASYLQSLNPK